MSDLVYDGGTRGPHPLRDPRVRVHVEDGRFFLLTTPERYDLITSEPPPPKHAGIVNLYTREYFQLVHDRLAEGGLNTYWLPVHSLMLEDTRAIIRAYCDVFADCTLWSGAGLNWMLAGSRNADWPRDEAAFAAQWRDASVAPELEHLGFGRPESMGATFLADAAHLDFVTEGVPPLVDDRPKRLSDETDFRASRLDHVAWLDSALAARRFKASEFIERAWPPGLRERTLGWFPVQQAIDRARGVRIEKPIHPAERVREIHAALRSPEPSTLALWWLEIDSDRLEAIERLLAAGAGEDRFAFQLGARTLARHDFADASARFENAATRERKPRTLPYLRVYARQRAGDAAGARSLGAALFGDPPRTNADADFLRWVESLSASR